MRIFRTMSILPDWAVVANALRSFWGRHTNRSESEGRFRSAAAMFWLILSMTTMTTIGLRPPPDDVGRQSMESHKGHTGRQFPASSQKARGLLGGQASIWGQKILKLTSVFSSTRTG